MGNGKKSGMKDSELLAGLLDYSLNRQAADSLARFYLGEMRNGAIKIDPSNLSFIRNYAGPEIKKDWDMHVRKSKGRFIFKRITGKSTLSFLRKQRGPFKSRPRLV